MSSYLKIPYDNAIKFLMSLDEDTLIPYYIKYDVNSVDALAEIIADEEILSLGYNKENDIKDEEDSLEIPNDYSIAYEDVVHFLENIDKYTLEDLMHKYDTNSIEDLAVAITDFELDSLGFNYKKEEKETTTQKYHHKSNLEYDEDLDYLEDITEDIDYDILDKENHIFGVNDELTFYDFKNSLDPNLVDTCEAIKEDLGLDCFAFKVTPKVYSDEQTQISEEVIINDKLNPLIFDSDNKIHEDIKDKLIDYAQKFIDKATSMGINIDYSDIVLAGSNAGYLYTPESDIDIHIVSAEPISEDIFDKLKTEFDLFEVENPLIFEDSEGNKHQVELGIEDGYNIVMDNKNPRRYSLLDNDWVADSDKYEVYTESDKSTVAGYEDIVSEYVDKINEVVDSDDYFSAKQLKNELRKNRSTDLANIGALSMGNVVFKELRNNGAYGKLREYLKSKESDIDG